MTNIFIEPSKPICEIISNNNIESNTLYLLLENKTKFEWTEYTWKIYDMNSFLSFELSLMRNDNIIHTTYELYNINQKNRLFRYIL